MTAVNALKAKAVTEMTPTSNTQSLSPPIDYSGVTVDVLVNNAILALTDFAADTSAKINTILVRTPIYCSVMKLSFFVIKSIEVGTSVTWLATGPGSDEYSDIGAAIQNALVVVDTAVVIYNAAQDDVVFTSSASNANVTDGTAHALGYNDGQCSKDLEDFTPRLIALLTEHLMTCKRRVEQEFATALPTAATAMDADTMTTWVTELQAAVAQTNAITMGQQLAASQAEALLRAVDTAYANVHAQGERMQLMTHDVFDAMAYRTIDRAIAALHWIAQDLPQLTMDIQEVADPAIAVYYGFTCVLITFIYMHAVLARGIIKFHWVKQKVLEVPEEALYWIVFILAEVYISISIVMLIFCCLISSSQSGLYLICKDGEAALLSVCVSITGT